MILKFEIEKYLIICKIKDFEFIIPPNIFY